MTRHAPLWQTENQYSAGLDRLLLSALFPVGGAVGGAVTPVNNTMQLSVAPGSCAVPLAAGQGAALCSWDAAELVTLAAAPPSGQSRVDLVVVQVRDDDLDAGGNNDFVVTNVTGAPAASNPAAPPTPANALVLALVTVAGAIANLNTAPIRSRVGALPGVATAGRLSGNVQSLVPPGSTVDVNAFGPGSSGTYLSGGMRADLGATTPNGLIVPVDGIYTVSAACFLQNSNNRIAAGESWLVLRRTPGAGGARVDWRQWNYYPYGQGWHGNGFTTTDRLYAGDKINLAMWQGGTDTGGSYVRDSLTYLEIALLGVVG